MKYLIINGGPRKGNTWKLVELACRQIIGDSPSSEFREIHLAKANLPFCLGCSACFREGDEHCPHHSVMNEIITGINWADGIIFATPTFNRAPTALVKNLFDHLCYMLHRPHFFTKKALVITTTGGVGAKAAAKSLAADLKGIGFNRVYLLPIVTHSWNDYSIDDKTKKQSSKVFREFCMDVESGKMHPPSAMLMIPYNLFRGMCLSNAPGTEYPTYDGIHWMDPVRAKSYYDSAIPVPLYKKPVGALFYQIGKLGGRMVSVSYKKKKEV